MLGKEQLTQLADQCIGLQGFPEALEMFHSLEEHIHLLSSSARETALALSKLADILTRDGVPGVPPLLYNKAAESFLLLGGASPFNVLMAAICYEKGEEFDKALNLYERFEQDGEIASPWDNLVSSFSLRTKGKLFQRSGMTAAPAHLFGLASAKMASASNECGEEGEANKWKLGSLELQRWEREAMGSFEKMLVCCGNPSLPGWSALPGLLPPPYSRSVLYSNNRELVSQRAFLFSGGMHGNEISGVLACEELAGQLSGKGPALLWPCVDSLGFYAEELLDDNEFTRLPDKLIPMNTALFGYAPAYCAFVVEATDKAELDWLKSVAQAALINSSDYPAKYLVWKASSQLAVNQPRSGGRSFVLVDGGLISSTAWTPDSPVIRYAQEPMAQHSIPCWLDLHEARGSGFHIYLSDPANKAILDCARETVKALSGFVAPNTSIWNRKALGDGLFELPNHSNNWPSSNRVVFEIGEELPLEVKVSLLCQAVRHFIRRYNA